MQQQTTILSTRKVVPSTVVFLKDYLYNNRNSLSVEMKLFYSDVLGFIQLELRKSVKRRASMDVVLERAYNLEKHMYLRGGVADFKVEFLKS